MQSDVDKLIVASDVPRIPEFAEEFFRCMNHGGLAWRRRENDDCRYTRWIGQDPSGRKWDKNNPDGKAMPWEGASDTRIPLADDIINDNVAMLTMAFWHTLIKTMAVNVGNLEESAWTNRLMEWLISSRIYQSLLTEVPLSAQYGQQYGWCAIHTGWERELSRRREKVGIEQLAVLLAGAQQLDPHMAIELLTNPTMEGEALTALKSLYFQFVRTQVSQDLVDDDEIPELLDSTGKKLLRGLREKGKGDMIVPFQLKNQPVIYALKPWSEFFMPPETCELQRARVVFWLDYMTEVEMEASALESGWNQDWIKEARNLKGQSFTRYNKNWVVLNEAPTQMNNDLIEVVHSYVRQVDDEGVPGITYTVFHPGVTKDKKGRPLCGRSDLLDDAHGKYPFAIYRREIPSRQIVESRGVADIALFWQNELKKQRDSLWDLTDLTTIPPISGPPTMGDAPRFGPATWIPKAYEGEIAFLNLPQQVPGVAMALIKEIKDMADDYFGRARPDGEQNRPVMKNGMTVNSFLGTWSEVLSQMISLCQQYLTDDQVARLTGGAYKFPRDSATIAAQMDTIMRMDVRDLNGGEVSKALEAICKYIIPMDQTGELDRATLTRLLTLSISPDIYRALQTDQNSGSKKAVMAVKSDLGNILLGIEPDYQENDPQAKFKLQVLQQLTDGSPTVQGLVKNNPHVAELLQKYLKSLQFSGQQQDNAAIGRLGVTPAPTQGMESGK